MQKSILSLLMSITMTAPVAAETLTVVISSLESTDGHIMLRILAGEQEFDGDVEAITSIKQRALAGDNTFTVDNLPAGDYGLQIMHDKNSNGKLDSNFVGMPTEPWGFSNNATGNMGPPAWSDVKFGLSGKVTQLITLNK
ncbi:MAG: DUF2141 domain-containing protein [Oceanicoccus sp.]